MVDVNGFNAKQAIQQAAERDLAHACMMAILYRLALAAGGTLKIPLNSVPKEVPLRIHVTDGQAFVVALPPAAKPNIVTVPAGFAEQLKG